MQVRWAVARTAIRAVQIVAVRVVAAPPVVRQAVAVVPPVAGPHAEAVAGISE